jgi:transcriptional regulator with XRE-family HTH domain
VKIEKEMSDDVILGELGHRLSRIRLDKNITQAQLAAQAGVSKRTIERLESGAVAAQLSGFIRVCRVLGLLEKFDLLVPEPVPSPLAQLKYRGRERQRAWVVREPGPAKRKWEWGEGT